MSRPTGTWAVIAGGGTTGHVAPAVAIGEALVDGGRPISAIHFVGSRSGIEARLVPAAGFGISLLPGRGVPRRLGLDSLRASAGIAAAVGEASMLMLRLRPKVVVSVGGYASVACVVAAGMLRIPLVVAEQNAVAGAANRLAGRLAKACAVAFPGVDLPRAVLTGNPVRKAVLTAGRSPRDRSAAREALNMPADRQLVAVSGGSLGSRRINTSIRELASAWAERSDLSVYHVVGARDWVEMTENQPAIPAGGLIYRQVRYEDRMELLYSAADIAVMRAGASTVTELAVVGLPSVLVPLPGAPNDHQTANALALVAAGAAVMVPDSAADATTLGRELDGLLADGNRLEAMSAAARALARPDAARAVAALVEEYAHA
jgi:UDP-N-acetylglucosamine--N-acetylmuramyl-(pentapeptide) pyrophosphoryl-undecaprenol N-acetylglucosamine transferase